MLVQALFCMCPKKGLASKVNRKPPSQSPAPDHPIKSLLDTPTSCMKRVLMGQGVSIEAMNALLAAPFCELLSQSPPTALREKLSRAKFSPRSDTNQIPAPKISFIPPKELPTDAKGSGEALLELSSVLRWN